VIAMCGAPPQVDDSASGLEGVNLAAETVIQGTVTAAGSPVPSAYVRLLDGSGEFTAEVVSSATGTFRFFAAPGDWIVRALARDGSGEVALTADRGITEAELAIAG